MILVRLAEGFSILFDNMFGNCSEPDAQVEFVRGFDYYAKEDINLSTDTVNDQFEQHRRSTNINTIGTISRRVQQLRISFESIAHLYLPLLDFISQVYLHKISIMMSFEDDEQKASNEQLFIEKYCIFKEILQATKVNQQPIKLKTNTKRTLDFKSAPSFDSLNDLAVEDKLDQIESMWHNCYDFMEHMMSSENLSKAKIKLYDEDQVNDHVELFITKLYSNDLCRPDDTQEFQQFISKSDMAYTQAQLAACLKIEAKAFQIPPHQSPKGSGSQKSTPRANMQSPVFQQSETKKIQF